MKRRCDQCGEEKNRVHKNRKTGKFTCPACYKSDRNADESIWALCVVCWKKKPVQKLIEDGLSVCPACAQNLRYRDRSKWESCSVCKIRRPVGIRINGKPLCHGCYHRGGKPPKPRPKKKPKKLAKQLQTKRSERRRELKLGRCRLCPQLSPLQKIAAKGLCMRHYQQKRREAKKGET